jgi:putative oxidoreductase
MTDTGKLVLRLTVAILLGFHGIPKMQRGVGWMMPMLTAHHLPTALAYGVYVAEVVAPILLIIGFLTRPAAIVIMIEMLFAMYLVLGPKTFVLNPQTGSPGGELNFFYLFASLAIAFLGSGRYAISRGKPPLD